MTLHSELLLSLERYLDATRNWNLYRPYQASLNQRVEGFTEQFGDATDDTNDNEEDTVARIARWKVEQVAVEHICATPHPFARLKLVQYRPAWLEQLTLRIFQLSYIVVNSEYAVTEATGPLPYLQDLETTPPAMMGRQTCYPQQTTGSGQNAILDYLRTVRKLDLDETLTTEQQSQSFLYQSLIREQLEPALVVLRYQDSAAWNQINRPRCLRAGSGTDKWPFLAPGLQARQERRYQQSRLSPAQRALSSEQAVEVARKAYRVLNTRLLQHHKGPRREDDEIAYLLGTTSPTLVDVILWDHLMDALTDLHLDIVIAEFPALVEFVQNIWEKYFASLQPVRGDGGKVARTFQNEEEDNAWQVWNAQQNEQNAFFQVPSLSTSNNGGGETELPKFEHAFELMEHLSVRERNLGESLMVAKQTRALQENKSRRRKPFETWHRWRLGGEFQAPKSQEEHAAAPNVAGKQEEKIRREYKRNDETWMASVALGTTLAVLLFGLGGGGDSPSHQ